METVILKQIILQQHTIAIKDNLTLRIKFKQIKNAPNIVILLGVRRCGKSTLLQQIRAVNIENDYYLNFDDERLLHFTKDDFQQLSAQEL